MSKARSAEELLVWQLHQMGNAISQIVAVTGYAESFVRGTITSIWFDDGVAYEAA